MKEGPPAHCPEAQPSPFTVEWWSNRGVQGPPAPAPSDVSAASRHSEGPAPRVPSFRGEGLCPPRSLFSRTGLTRGGRPPRPGSWPGSGPGLGTGDVTPPVAPVQLPQLDRVAGPGTGQLDRERSSFRSWTGAARGMQLVGGLVSCGTRPTEGWVSLKYILCSTYTLHDSHCRMIPRN